MLPTAPCWGLNARHDSWYHGNRKLNISSSVLGEFFLIWIRDLKTEGAVRCRDCEALWGKCVILGYKNKSDLNELRKNVWNVKKKDFWRQCADRLNVVLWLDNRHAISLLSAAPHESDRPAARDPTADGEEPPRRSCRSTDVEQQKSLNQEIKKKSHTKLLFWWRRNQQWHFQPAGGGRRWERALFMVMDGNGQTLSGWSARWQMQLPPGEPANSLPASLHTNRSDIKVKEGKQEGQKT